MFYRITTILAIICFSVVIAGCSAMFSEQEWSTNYALLDGVHATNPEMIDGDIGTVGVTNHQSTSNNVRNVTNPSPEIVITLPEKKVVRRIVIHSDNIVRFNLYADKGGSALSDTDWKLIKEAKAVKSSPIVVPILYSFPTDKIRLVVLGTSDDAALTRKRRCASNQKYCCNPIKRFIVRNYSLRDRWSRTSTCLC